MPWSVLFFLIVAFTFMRAMRGTRTTWRRPSDRGYDEL